MKEETLLAIREELKELKKEIAKYNKKVERVSELERDKKVAEYRKLLEITGTITKDNRTDNDLIREIYPNYCRQIESKDTNGIYLYKGAYRDDSSDRMTSEVKVRDERIATLKKYINLESGEFISMPISEAAEFERENNLINIDQSQVVEKQRAIRDEFFVTAVNSDQATAKKLVLKKYGKLNK